MADAPENLLLTRLRTTDRSVLTTRARLVELTARQVLLMPGQRIEHVHFPVDGAIALVVGRAGHLPMEVGLVGAEGLVGLSAVFGARRSSLTAVVQQSGLAWRVDAGRLVRQLRISAPLRDRMARYAHVRWLQLAHAARCKSFHRLDARLARWLLMSRDRARSAELRMTHDSLAQMLGTRRAGVTVAANALRERDLIRYSRGRVAVLDATALERLACRCYLNDKRIYAQVMG